jgi:murein DD-endopeptidase MepM/ murein hydrolase activator NlpD
MQQLTSFLPPAAWLALLLLLLGPFPGQTLRAGEPVRVQVPERAAIGEPIVVRLRSRVPYERAAMQWLEHNGSVDLSGSNGSYTATALLGSDVKRHKPGARRLRITLSGSGRYRQIHRDIRLTEKERPVQRLTLPEKMVSLSQSELARHRRESGAVGKALGTYRPRRDWSLPLARPAKGEISSRYGLRRILNGQPRSPHRGIDLRTGHGARVRSCARGRVVLTGEHYFAGKSVYVDHGLGVVSMYFHLSEISVEEGQRVARGQGIGLSGKSGRTTGPHLHFGVSVRGNLVDPLPLLEE